MIRRRFEWKIRDRVLPLGERTLVMGIVNVTPDSFSDGGCYNDADLAAARVLDLQEQGADIIDIGAESTRPASERVPEAEELRRLIPVLKRLKGRVAVPLSVDTYKPGVAQIALEHGVQIINDVSGLTWEPDLAAIVRDSNAGLVLNHLRGTPETWARMAPMRDVAGEIAAELEAAVHRARHAHIELDHIVIDPGIGFGKRREQSSEIIARLDELLRLELPLLVGPSRKSFLAQKDPRLLEFASAAAVTAAILNGACIVRVHDVEAMRAVVQVTDAIIDAIPEPAEEPERRRTVRQDFDLRPERVSTGPARPPVKRAAPAPPPRVERDDRAAGDRRPAPKSGYRGSRDEPGPSGPGDSRRSSGPRGTRGSSTPRDRK